MYAFVRVRVVFITTHCIYLIKNDKIMVIQVKDTIVDGRLFCPIRVIKNKT